MVAVAVALLVALLAGGAHAEDRPLIGEPIDEGSTPTVTFFLEDSTGAPITPLDLLCWADDEDTTVRVYGPTSLTPAAPVVLILPSSATQIVTGTKDLEVHKLTCQGRYPAGCTPGTTCLTSTGELRYAVRNLRIIVGGLTPRPSPALTPTP